MAETTDITAAGGTVTGSVTSTETSNINTATAASDVQSNSNSTVPIVTNPNANPGSVESLKQPDGTYRLEITGYNKEENSYSNPDDAGEIIITAQAAVKQTPLDNPLHDYDSYTYGLSLHLLNINDYNSLISNPEQTYSPVTNTPTGPVGTVLVASAGRYQNYGRNPAFVEDFYFEDFRMNTYINTTSRNKNSNLIECNFTLIEPTGFTFINRLIAAADMVNGTVGNYTKMPYLLQVEFFGQKNGVISSAPIQGMTKMIPITLIDIKTRITPKGAEYKVHAVPFNHQAFNQTNVASPADFLINAKTVQDVFGTGDTSKSIASSIQIFQDLEREESELNKRLSVATSDAVRESLLSQLGQIQNNSGQINVSGYTNALNSWWENLQTQGYVVAINKINVEFDPEIAAAELYAAADGPVSVQQVAVTGSTTQDQKAAMQASGGAAKGKVDFKAGVMSVPAGTSIQTLIDWAVRNSSYITDQMKDKSVPASQDAAATIASQLGKPLKWYRIVPRIKITNFDQSTNMYTMNITYCVKTWTVNAKHPQGPLGRVPGYIKDYQYLYTGKNKDIIDLQIDFNLMYLVQTTAARNTPKGFSTAPALGDPAMAYANDGNPNSKPDGQQQGPTVIQYGKLQPVPTAYFSRNIKSQGRTGSNQNKATTAGDVKESIQNDSKGDMIHVKMRIIGDPHFIKQDDIFFNQSSAKGVGQLTPNGSLYTDNGELYVNLLVRFPVDYNEATGLAIPANSQYNRSEWSGIYKIITVDNEFVKGKFEQVLTMARLPIPDELLGQDNNVQQRLDSLNLLSLGQTNPFQAVRFTGPNILKAAAQIPAYNAAAAAVQGGSNQMQALLAQAQQSIVNSVINSANKAVTTAIKPYLDAANRSINSWWSSDTGKYIEGSDTFVGPVRGNGVDSSSVFAVNGSDLASDQTYFETAQQDFDSLITDMQNQDFGLGDYNLSGFEDIPDVGIVVDPAEYALSLGDFAG